MNKFEKVIDYPKVNDLCFINDEYSNIYFHSNEYLKSIFNQVDIYGKECLTVVGSGDQAFHMYDGGAKCVDFFDINKNAINYFYLRRWLITYFDKFYPVDIFKKGFILNLLSCVKPKNIVENDAYQYWLGFAYYLEDYEKFLLENLFISSNDLNRNNIEDLSKIKTVLENDDVNFYNVDLSDENLSINKKYDIIFISNISDHIYSMYKKVVYRNNLVNLLNDNGKIIATYVSDSCRRNDEFVLFNRYFDMVNLKKDYDNFVYKCPGYVYTKKGRVGR